MNLDEIIKSPESSVVISEAWFKKRDKNQPRLTPEQQARRDAERQAAEAKSAKFAEKRQRDTARLRTKETPSDIPVVGADVPAPPRTPLPKKPKHEDNGGVGPRFGDYVESGNGLWKIVGNDSANMVTFIQNPQSGEKQAVEWSELSKDRDHNGKTIFVRG